MKESQLTNYRLKVSLDLPDFPTEVSDCNDPNCNHHSALLDSYRQQLVDCLFESASSTLPAKHLSSSCVPGWNHGARALKEKANLWHRIWREAGSPSSGILSQIK